ncbi:hypothetical protein CIW83_02740 [Tissierella sp. P1]|uniref:lanthionine synthetase LanC family protein n=1 Tax=Tissierella sp. P1 TaxID=1280483 RepID=UPI000BA02E78|nr:lanthionine synthetase LanC family protein [Tissierella sp. P1]OZV13479.1 hypothetical protein CIW83_02740 [Tissierella sp. P1]
MVCHGYSGLAAIMKGMYNDTKNTVFLNKAMEIANLIIYRMSNNKDNDISIDDFKKYSYLEGYSGVLETIYSLIMNKLNVNEQRLLII